MSDSLHVTFNANSLQSLHEQSLKHLEITRATEKFKSRLCSLSFSFSPQQLSIYSPHCSSRSSVSLPACLVCNTSSSLSNTESAYKGDDALT